MKLGLCQLDKNSPSYGFESQGRCVQAAILQNGLIVEAETYRAFSN